MTRTASYDLGRARGIVTGRWDASEADDEWWASQPGVDAEDGQAYDDFTLGMLDGRDQATSRKLGLPCPEPPSPEALAAAREGSALPPNLRAFMASLPVDVIATGPAARAREIGAAFARGVAEDAPALCPCGDRLATMAGYCDECRADAHRGARVLHGTVLRIFLLFAFGSPRTAFALRILAALSRLCPCAPTDGLCLALHRESAAAIAIVSGEQRDPERAAATLTGLAVHESCARVERQASGGPAVTVWQLEVRPSERAALLADPVLAARVALRAANGCGGSLVGYAWGRCDGADAAHLRAAAELRASVLTAWWALAQ